MFAVLNEINGFHVTAQDVFEALDNARGGAAIESLTPRHKFDDHPLAARYADWVEQRRAEFDWDAAVQKLVEKWENDVAQSLTEGFRQLFASSSEVLLEFGDAAENNRLQSMFFDAQREFYLKEEDIIDEFGTGLRQTMQGFADGPGHGKQLGADHVISYGEPGFAERVRELYPGCPQGRETQIAEHACRKYSGRVGRSAAAKTLDREAVRLAVTAHVRHAETNYDDLLLNGIERWEARDKVYSDVSQVLDRWEHGGPQD